jgi:hypothetical protein
VATVTDKIEEVDYDLGRAGDLAACAYWLKAHRPRPYDRATMLRFGILQASLAAAQANGGGRVTIDIGPDGLPCLPAPGLDPVRTGEGLEPIHLCCCPTRGAVLTPPADDGSGRNYPCRGGRWRSRKATLSWSLVLTESRFRAEQSRGSGDGFLLITNWRVPHSQTEAKDPVPDLMVQRIAVARELAAKH